MTTQARTPGRTDFLALVLVCAVEGGINYWAVHRKYRWHAAEDGNFTEASVEVSDAEGEGDQNDWKAVTLDTIESGIAKVKEIGIRRDLMEALLMGDRESDAGYIDSEVADCIVQAGLFGRVIYG